VEENDTFFYTITGANEVTPKMPDNDLIIDDCTMHHNSISLYEAHTHEEVTNYETLRPLFGWLPVDVIKRTFAVTTQYARNP
jgi:hypothetical protein